MNLPAARLQSVGLLLLRVAFGCMMLVHGVQKITGFGAAAENFPDPIGLGAKLSLILTIAAEAGFSVLLILGLCSRLAALPLAFTVFVALFVVHGSDPWKAKELAAAYLAVYVVLAVAGPGSLSLDRLLRGKK